MGPGTGGRRSTGARLADARKAHGMTQAQLADSIGVTRDVIASIETGRRPFDLEEAVASGIVLSRDVHDFVDMDAVREILTEASKEALDRAQYRLQIAMRDLDRAKEFASRVEK